MGIREFFHLIHIVDDEDEVDAFYGRLFEPQQFTPKHWMEGEKRWASLSMVSDLMLEVIEPSGEPADRHMPLSKLPHSATFRVLDLDAAEKHVAAVGVSVADREAETITLEPADCFGALWAFTERDIPGDPRVTPRSN